MRRLEVNDGPDDHCFGCGQRNELGLRLEFYVCENGDVEIEYNAPQHFEGGSGIVHGGIQAVLLDEVMGKAVHEATSEKRASVVTADFQLRYRRPVPVGAPLLIRGRVQRQEGRDFFAEAEIKSQDGEILTRAESRWRHLPT